LRIRQLAQSIIFLVLVLNSINDIKDSKNTMNHNLEITEQTIIFKIADDQAIIIKNLCCEGDHFYRYDPIEIFFYNKDICYLLSQHDYLLCQLEEFYGALKKAMQDKLELIDPLCDLGYLWNQYLHKSNQDNEEIEDDVEWDVRTYLVWSGKGYDTWLYTKESNVLIQITPTYKWHYLDPEEHLDFVPYDEWIKNYKSLFTIEIDKKTAQEWLEAIEELLKKIIENDAIYLHRE